MGVSPGGGASPFDRNDFDYGSAEFSAAPVALPEVPTCAEPGCDRAPYIEELCKAHRDLESHRAEMARRHGRPRLVEVVG